ncbi:ABC transporter substrate-binding protein [Halopseudomonas pachastrellae]|nr:ABC transporter substrate-binding protein [Halopseudomonas pachastrellae]
MSDLLKGFVAAATLLLCALPAQARSVTDAYGETVDVPDQPQRVVALSELDLDAMLALGKTPVGTVNGRGQNGVPGYLSERVPQIDIIGDLGNVNTELLLELQPDLILTATDRPETLELYRAIAPTVVTANRRALAGQPAADRQRTGEPEAADAFTASYQTRVQQAREALAAEQGQTMSIVRWNPKGPVYMLEDSFASQIVKELGFVRPEQQRQPGFTHSQALSLESLDLLDADWLVVGTLAGTGEAAEALNQARDTPAFQQLGAVKAGQMAAVDGSLWTSVGGPLAAMQVIDDVENLIKASARQ